MTFDDKSISSRRRILSMGAAAGLIGVMGAPGVAYGAVHDHEVAPAQLSVRNFGAAGDAATDDTAAFQRALDAGQIKCAVVGLENLRHRRRVGW